MSLTEFEFESSKAPEVLLWGFVELHSLRDLDAQVRCATEGGDVASVSIYDAARSIDIRMYRLPAADAAFTDDLKFFGQQPRSWPLPDGRAFDQNILFPQGVPTTWKHKAIQISGVRLTFNMIEAGELPPSRPKAYLMLSTPS